MNKIALIIILLVLPILSFHAKDCVWNEQKIREYIKDNNVVDLILAAQKGDIEKMDELVAQGADVNYKGKENATPLFIQFTSFNMDGFRKLLELGANPNIPISTGRSVIWYLAGAGQHLDKALPMLKLCLEHGGDPNWVFHSKHERGSSINDGNSLLIQAASHNEDAIEAIELLLNAGADINARNSSGDTALYSAAVVGRYDVVLQLLQYGADYSIKNNYGSAFYDTMEKTRIVLFNKSEAELKYQKECREKVIAFLNKKGIKVKLKYP